MTVPPLLSRATGPVLVWDTSPLLHSVTAGKIDVLHDFARTWSGGPRRNVTTETVRHEITRQGVGLDGLDWLDVVRLDDLDELNSLVVWMERVSGQKSNQGEATVLAWADLYGAVAVVDDGDARRIGRKHGLGVCGSLRIVAEALADGRTTEYVATTFVDTLIGSGMRYPCEVGGFLPWAKQNGLL
ncbi:hypothetical protein [Actinacidiphila rubida]|uniref:Predicted nucleic acid-binding protein, contains PIN domain n=1 Tax=Actinacidiphila rubida TaxID=310780 RepID=A0A1H8MNP7_9ACTN|nr:hypothetical protein [Actinacidiphila rubida]SEO18854.1 Predicted nucleic acid-binding protein, contains PIN domain [Actinacidiphila rubida]